MKRCHVDRWGAVVGRRRRSAGDGLVAVLLWVGMAAGLMAVESLPTLVLTEDDTVVRESCEVAIPAGTVIRDANGDGVLRVEADDITIRFAAGSVLRGAPAGTAGDAMGGIGIRVEGRRGVRIEGARVEGYRNGLVALRAPGLVVDGGEFADGYRQRLRSTPEAEDGSDWLFPHRNDERKWRDEYGGAVCVEASAGVTIRGVRVRDWQNGILLDRVEGGRVYDNDASFLSGWGLAMWRSSRNLVSRNAFDFCIRGHVEGVYNRGQDSAGILCFEQSHENVFVENSATHGGDGFFGFAGREALGEHWMEEERARLRRETGEREVDDRIRVPAGVAAKFSALGCNGNVLIGNDFSYASAHGIEMTFSEGNIFAGNRLVGNAICGIWAGYASDTWITGNEIAGNGGMAYGLERGGINAEHASRLRILGNTFRDNRCAIHLWWDPDLALRRLPGVLGNDRGVTENVIAGNTFEITKAPPFGTLRAEERLLVLHLRDDGDGNVRGNRYTGNVVRLDHPQAREFEVCAGCEPESDGPVPEVALPTVEPVGTTRPVGARAALRGRHRIVMDEWGPWDHERPLVRALPGRGRQRTWEVRGVTTEPRIEATGAGWTSRVRRGDEDVWEVVVEAGDGVTPFDLRVRAPGLDRRLEGTIVAAEWEAVFFPWSVDPREDIEGWRAEAGGPGAVTARLGALDFAYGWGGPRDLRVLNDETRSRAPGGDRFGMRARTRLRLPAGRWRFTVLSDDGVRVRAGGSTVVENWTWHGPTTDTGVYRQEQDGEIELEVEHFEIDGYAVLRVEVSREEAEER
ncbi:MAG: right-handed parallel beta-helix repeat-containing protein [Verrucomicrobiae bacterium]|nr:right-handed parallel beta-helix repeat-containing protein [Verrucomicrobiae bacterium]